MLVKNALRLKMGMTQQDLAGTDFTKSFISQIEKNHAVHLQEPAGRTDRLGKPISYFLDDMFHSSDLTKLTTDSPS